MLFSPPPRVGQLLATTLPTNETINENIINLYHDDESPTPSNPTGEEFPAAKARFGRFRDDEGKQRRAVVLRNILLDVLLSLLSRNLELNHQYAPHNAESASNNAD